MTIWNVPDQSTMDDAVRKVAFCPHCGNRSPQKLVHTQQSSTIGWASDGEADEVPITYFVAACETCSGILVYLECPGPLEEKFFTEARLVFPQAGTLHRSVPESIAEIYGEAARIKALAPNAFAVQIRKALEALCADRGARRGDLQSRLKVLAEKAEIPGTLAEVTDVLRLLGNVGAHVSDDSVKPWQVHSIDDFFRAVVEYVYVAPSKLKEFRDGLNVFRAGRGSPIDEG